MTVSTNTAKNGIFQSSSAGTATNGDAIAGDIGQQIMATIASGSAVALTTATTANVTSISLTAGDWELIAQINFSASVATVSELSMGPSLTAATLPTQAGGSGMGPEALTLFSIGLSSFTGVHQLASMPVRISIAATTTIYLTSRAVFTLGSVSVYGTIRARRVR